jgi:septum formation protein
MLKDLLTNYKVILASASPRRQAFFKALDIDFEIRLKPIEESYPKHLKGSEISDYLATLKASAFKNELKEKELLITSDTIVWHHDRALGKPADKEEAVYMLQGLSGEDHLVISSVCLTSINQQIVFNDITEVSFKPLSLEEIRYYVNHYKPFDKAGAYGIQEWIGAIGITHIKGSYNNVVGLPTQKLYETLKAFIEGA